MLKDVIQVSKDLLFIKPFYGSVLISLNKEINNKKTKTAAVGLQKVMYKLYINSDFWGGLTEKHKMGILMHELGHIVNFHLTEYEHLKNHKIANIAMDLYINQTIPRDMLPESGCFPEKFDLPEGMDTNWYYKALMEQNEQQNQSNPTLQNIMDALNNGDSQALDGDGNPIDIPDHDWDDIQEASSAVKKVLQKNTEAMLSRIVEQMKKSNPGSIPGGLEDLLERLAIIEPPKFNWRAYLKRFVGTSTKTWVRKTRRKKSKRFPDMAGSREHYYSNILVALDTSLSMSKDDLRQMQNELIHMHKTGHDITILLCDTKINKEFKFNPRMPLDIDGRGGTNFQPVIDYYNKRLTKYSCLIYLSDGEASAPENVRGNVLWVHGTEHEINEKLPGKKVKLN